MGDFQFKKMNNQGSVHWRSDNSGGKPLCIRGKPHYDDNFSSLCFNSDKESLYIPVETEHISHDEELCMQYTINDPAQLVYV